MTLCKRAIAAMLVAGLVSAFVTLSAAPARASAAALPDVGLGDVSLDQGSYVAHENQGYLTITIVRTGNLLRSEDVGFGVKQQDGRDGIDFDVVPNTYVTMAPGQLVYTFRVHIIDRGMNGPPVHALAYIYGGYPSGLGVNTNSMITILRDDPLQPRNNANPLDVPGPVGGNPIAGARLYVAPDSPSAQAARQYADSNPQWSSQLHVIADEPGAYRFWMWNMTGDIAGQIAHYLENADLAQPGSTVMFSSYNLVHGACGTTTTPDVVSRYENFMDQMARGIGNFHVIYFLEFDSLITSPCLTPSQLQIRLAELRYAVTALERDPHVVVYLDGGAADAVRATDMARLLGQAGVHQAQGFFLNSTHFDWTQTELNYGERISNMLGGVHFVINTGENGRGPLVPASRVRSGNEVLCNPPGRGLGPLSVSNGVATQTGYPNADGFLWFSNPGGSGGQCVPGAPPSGQFWPAYAVMLVGNWVNRVTGPPATQASSTRGRAHHRRTTHKHVRRHKRTRRHKH